MRHIGRRDQSFTVRKNDAVERAAPVHPPNVCRNRMLVKSASLAIIDIR